MTALAVVALILGFIAADWVVMRNRRRTGAGEAAAPLIPRPRPPADRFVDPGHSWARLTARGIQIGVDDLLAAALGLVDRIEAAAPGKSVSRGDPLLKLGCGDRWLTVPAPVAGEVLWHNAQTLAKPAMVTEDPYGDGWIVALAVEDPQRAIAPLRLGNRAAALLEAERGRLEAFLSEADQAPVEGALRQLDLPAWDRFQAQFLNARAEPT